MSLWSTSRSSCPPTDPCPFAGSYARPCTCWPPIARGRLFPCVCCAWPSPLRSWPHTPSRCSPPLPPLPWPWHDKGIRNGKLPPRCCLCRRLVRRMVHQSNDKGGRCPPFMGSHDAAIERSAGVRFSLATSDLGHASFVNLFGVFLLMLPQGFGDGVSRLANAQDQSR